MIDTYSKIILTVIAGALVAIFTQQMVQSASAQFGIALGCDGSRDAPCYIHLMN